MEQAQEALNQYAIPDLLPGGHTMHTSPSPGSMKSKGSDLRLFKCLTCGKDFKQKSTLLQHERYKINDKYMSNVIITNLIIFLSKEFTRIHDRMDVQTVENDFDSNHT